MRKRAEVFLRHFTAVIRELVPWVVLFSSLVVARFAHAAEGRVVLLTDAGSEAAEEVEAQLVAAARGQLAEIDVDVVSFPAASSTLAGKSRRARELGARDSTLGVVWVERSASMLVIFFYDPRGPRLYARRFAASGSPAAASEEIAVVLRSALSAVREGDAVGMVEVRLPELALRERARQLPRPTAPAALAAPADPVLSARIGYVGTLYAVDTAWQNGMSLSLALQPDGAFWYVAAGYTFLPRLDLVRQGTKIELQRHVGELIAGFRLRLSPAWFLAEGAALADRVERTTSKVREGLLATEDSARWQWAISTRIGGELPLGRCARARFTVGAEFLLSRFDQVVTTEGSSEESVASPMLARPRLEAGLVVPLW